MCIQVCVCSYAKILRDLFPHYLALSSAHQNPKGSCKIPSKQNLKYSRCEKKVSVLRGLLDHTTHRNKVMENGRKTINICCKLGSVKLTIGILPVNDIQVMLRVLAVQAALYTSWRGHAKLHSLCMYHAPVQLSKPCPHLEALKRISF